MGAPEDDPEYLPETELAQLEQFVNWLGRSAALSEVFPDYVLVDSTDYQRAEEGIAHLLPHVLMIATRINPAFAERIAAGINGDESRGAAANACQGLVRVLERASASGPIVDCDGTMLPEQ
jgi:hypothetical protein